MIASASTKLNDPSCKTDEMKVQNTRPTHTNGRNLARPTPKSCPKTRPRTPIMTPVLIVSQNGPNVDLRYRFLTSCQARRPAKGDLSVPPTISASAIGTARMFSGLIFSTSPHPPSRPVAPTTTGRLLPKSEPAFHADRPVDVGARTPLQSERIIHDQSTPMNEHTRLRP